MNWAWPDEKVSEKHTQEKQGIHPEIPSQTVKPDDEDKHGLLNIK